MPRISELKYEVMGPMSEYKGVTYWVQNPDDIFDRYCVEVSSSGIRVMRRGIPVYNPKELARILGHVVTQTAVLTKQNKEVKEAIRAFCKKKVGFQALKELAS